MQVTEVRLTKASSEDACLAYGSITLDGDFVVSGIRIVESKEGRPFVSYPSRKNQSGEYKNIVALDGKPVFKVRSVYTERLVENIQKLIDGEDVNIVW